MTSDSALQADGVSSSVCQGEADGMSRDVPPDVGRRKESKMADVRCCDHSGRIIEGKRLSREDHICVKYVIRRRLPSEPPSLSPQFRRSTKVRVRKAQEFQRVAERVEP